MENKNISETEQIMERIDEKISGLYKRLDLILISIPEEVTNEPASSKLVEALVAIETRLTRILENIRL